MLIVYVLLYIIYIDSINPNDQSVHELSLGYDQGYGVHRHLSTRVVQYSFICCHLWWDKYINHMANFGEIQKSAQNPFFLFVHLNL
jgi:hypothetical protein